MNDIAAVEQITGPTGAISICHEEQPTLETYAFLKQYIALRESCFICWLPENGEDNV